MEELNLKINTTRPTIPPKSLLNTATELSEDEEDLKRKTAKHDNSVNSAEQILMEKLKQLEDKKKVRAHLLYFLI